MTRIEREKRVVRWMIEIWCRSKHGTKDSFCPECKELCDYSIARLSNCRFGNDKTSCKKCPVHCYKPQMREKIRQVMRFSGPRMILYHPIEAVRHLLQK